MKSYYARGILYVSLVLLVVATAACTQSKPAVPTPTLVPLANEPVIAPTAQGQPGQPTPIIVDTIPTSQSGENPTLVPSPAGNETPAAPTEGQPTPIIVEPTLLPTPTTVGDAGQPAQATPAPGTDSTTQQPSGGACSNPYTVKPGEWFYLIARNCGVSPEALLAANPGMNPSVLVPGQTLNMPGGGSTAPQQPPSSGGQQPPPSSGTCTNPYVVQSGDTLNSIARACGTTAAALQAANNIPAPDYIFPGQQLTIP